ncbi:sigma-70 family RNA polymerase sigma factor [Methylobacterium nigriterrae]|uniref:sigma-70 family RNA polymerase sigma factor n=1 Tax=Methylobacterium nigriterrae TaxID=3127512 RepID=UPI00301324F9
MNLNIKSAEHAPAPAERSEPDLPAAIRGHLGQHLRALYGPVESWVTTEQLSALLGRLEAALTARGEALTAEVRLGIEAAMPSLRAFALSLTRNSTAADDLMQETLLKAWRRRESYQPGTKLDAWLFTILRNTYYSGYRKRVREVEDVDDKHAATLSIAPAQEDRLNLQDMQRALEQFPSDQREALLLVAVNDMSYEEAAAIMECKLGTIKSRASRARVRLMQLLGYSDTDLGSDWLPHQTLDRAKFA